MTYFTKDEPFITPCCGNELAGDIDLGDKCPVCGEEISLPDFDEIIEILENVPLTWLPALFMKLSEQCKRQGVWADCEHHWVFIESIFTEENSGYQSCWKRLDRFFCEKCLEQKEVSKEEWSRERPQWFKR